MSSCGFTSNADYLNAALEFLKNYQWIFRHKNIDILTKRVLTHFPSHWIKYFEQLSTDDLHKIILGQTSDETPEDLKVFFAKIKSLNMSSDNRTLPALDSLVGAGLSRKKAHEIALLAPVIHEICESTGSDLIVDIGSGLGHLPHLLFSKYNYPVLALEASKKLVQTAKANQAKLRPGSDESVFFHELVVTEASFGSIEALAEERFGPDKKICLTGLHACADLSMEALKLFEKMRGARAVVVMPCCYHRMTAGGEKYFKNFPCSAAGKILFDEHDASRFVGPPFLRLACQRTVGSFVRMSGAEHSGHARQFMRRALLQLVAETDNCSVRRLKRKTGKSVSTDSEASFETYLNDLPKTHELLYPDGGHHQRADHREHFLIKMREKWNEHKNDCRLVGVLAGLQAAIQSVCENVILLDRVEFLKERGIHCCSRKITNDSVSPRCRALIATKNMRVQ